MEEKRKQNIIFSKTGRGATTCKISLPIPWIKEIGFTEEDKESIIEIKDKTITIKKSTD